MKDERNYHQRLQEFCDCFLETDFKGELEKASKGISGDPGGDPNELALKFLGLMVLYGANENARKISLNLAEDEKVLFSVEALGNYQLPPPAPRVAKRVISIARAITHIEDAQGQEPVSMGIRNDRLELTFNFDRREKGETFAIVFPAL